MSLFQRFDDIPRARYGVIYADPAWTFVTRSDNGKGRSAEQHYGCLSIDEIKAMPVASLAAPDSACLMWITDPHLPLGLEVLEAWGFRFVTVGFYWVKRNKNAQGLLHTTKKGLEEFWPDSSFFGGMGYWSRANPEMCLLGTRGHPKRLHKDVRRLVVTKRREHSRKPDEMYQRIERLLGGPYLELFGRTAQPGWDVWGNEAGKFVPKSVSSLDNSVNLVHNQS